MANIFISYGDNRFYYSLRRIKQLAKRTGRFDQIIVYEPKDLPPCVQASPLFAFPRGGGYWVWKPYVIYHTLEACSVGDVVYYADAGCTLHPQSAEWDQFAELMKQHSALFFQYRPDYDYGWSSPERCTTAIRHWTKPATVEYFTKRFGSDKCLDYNKILGGGDGRPPRGKDEPRDR